MFVERLENLAAQVDGTLLAAMVASDGIPVEFVDRDSDLDIEVLAAELMSQVRAVSLNHQELAVGDVRFMSISTDRYSLIVSALTDEYYLLLVIGADSNLGRARFELRRAVLSFERDLV